MAMMNCSGIQTVSLVRVLVNHQEHVQVLRYGLDGLNKNDPGTRALRKSWATSSTQSFCYRVLVSL
jgi:hypothetical protein